MGKRIKQEEVLKDLEFPDAKRPVILTNYVYEEHPELFNMPPHSHNFYELFFCENNSGAHYVNFQGFPIKKDRLYIIDPGQIHFLDNRKINAKVLLFKKDFLSNKDFQFEFLLPNEKIKFINFKNEALTVFRLLLQLIAIEQNRKSPDYIRIKSYIQSIFIEINHLYKTSGNKNFSMLCNFLELIGKNYMQHKKIHFYASNLHITVKALNDNIKRNTNRTPKFFINNRILNEANNLLLQRDIPINQIAYSLGFEDASYFTRFYKRQLKLTPNQFREKHTEFINKLQYPKSKWISQ